MSFEYYNLMTKMEYIAFDYKFTTKKGMSINEVMKRSISNFNALNTAFTPEIKLDRYAIDVSDAVLENGCAQIVKT